MSNYPFDTFPLTKRVGIVNPVANLDARYGPWPTLSHALTAFSSLVREVGLTVAVSGVEGVTEYWYKDGIQDGDLVLKTSSITPEDIIPTVTNYLSTNLVLISSVNVFTKILSGGVPLENIFLTQETDSQTLSFTASSYTLSISNGNSVSLSSINSTFAANSSNYESVYNTVSNLSSNWNDAYDISTAYSNISSTFVTNNIKILAEEESTLDVKNYTSFVKKVTSSNNFLFSNFLSGQTITIYLSADHQFYERHYFPFTTFLNKAGEGNIAFTFEGYATKVVLQNVGNSYIGTANVIPINATQTTQPIDGSMLLDGVFGYLKQEDGSYILVSSAEQLVTLTGDILLSIGGDNIIEI
jgi:hypothetical protein